jgi:glycosyltransferase involved in cell wall biosynthesis
MGKGARRTSRRLLYPGPRIPADREADGRRSGRAKPVPAVLTATVAPRVAIAHEWLVSYAGSERCVEQLLVAFPDARLLTTLVDREAVPPPLRRAEPSFLQHVPGGRDHHEWLVPLMPLAWRLREPLAAADVVVSSSHACAKAVRIAPGIPHVCYCHTPMRYAWDFAAEQNRFPASVRPLARAGMRWFRRWDRATANRVTMFVANSTAVAARIRAFYGRDATVVHPPADTEFFTPGGTPSDHFLYVGRLVGYKRPDLVIEMFRDLPYRLIVVGEGAARTRLERGATPNVEFVGNVDAGDLRELYRTAIAVVHPGEEDFGIAMAEAQACGAPVVARCSGGAVDIVDSGRTGWLVDGDEVEAWRTAVERCAVEPFNRLEIAERAQRFSSARFRHEMSEIVVGQAAGAE